MNEELDRELDEIVRDAYSRVNQDYLRQQAIIALKAQGKNPDEIEAWLSQAEIGISGGVMLCRGRITLGQFRCSSIAQKTGLK